MPACFKAERYIANAAAAISVRIPAFFELDNLAAHLTIS
jgi:hypothetical protein